MADMIATGLEWLSGKQTSHLSRTVTYRRGTDSVSLTAMLGQSQLVPINALGMEPSAADELLADPEEVDRDYIIVAEDLILNGSAVEPQAGDKIDDTNDETGVTHRYEVMSLPGQTPWRRLKGSYSLRIRIHTKHYGTV